MGPCIRLRVSALVIESLHWRLFPNPLVSKILHSFPSPVARLCALPLVFDPSMNPLSPCKLLQLFPSPAAVSKFLYPFLSPRNSFQVLALV
jgi:hypothetical protein